MSTVGLTKARERALDYAKRGRYDLIKRPAWVRLREAELVDRDGKLTPRGYAALAAPRIMTRENYQFLCRIERGEFDLTFAPMPEVRKYCRMIRLGWVDKAENRRIPQLNAAGRTALNNVRAAMGSPDWKEEL